MRWGSSPRTSHASLRNGCLVRSHDANHVGPSATSLLKDFCPKSFSISSKTPTTKSKFSKRLLGRCTFRSLSSTSRRVTILLVCAHRTEQLSTAARDFLEELKKTSRPQPDATARTAAPQHAPGSGFDFRWKQIDIMSVEYLLHESPVGYAVGFTFPNGSPHRSQRTGFQGSASG